MNKRRIIAIVCTVLSVAVIVFIFSNSLLSADISSQQSGEIVEAVAEILIKMGIPSDMDTLSFIIRKLAHFTEYFVLGGLLFTSFWLFGAKKPFVFAVAVCLAVATSDEFVMQRITEGRSPEIRDCLIDLCGASLSSGIIYFIKRKRYSDM